MKLYRNAIILVVVLGLLVGAYFIIKNQKSSSGDAADSTAAGQTLKVLEVKQDDINSMEFNNESGSFTLKKKSKDEWTIEPASEFPLNLSGVTTAASSLSSVIADKLVEENATDLTKYGLDKPATVKVGLADGTSKEIEIGSSNATKDGIYIKNKGESKVYLINTYSAESLKLTRSTLATKDILPVEGTAINTFSYEKNGELQYKINVPSEGVYNITAPVKEEGNSSDIGPMFAAVVKLTVKDIVDENPADLSKYGLDKPAYAIEYGDGKTTKKILFGKEVEKGSVAYAKFPEGKTVFTIDITPLTFLDVKLADIISTFVYLPNINDVSKIELLLDGTTTVAEITTDSENSDNDKFKVNGKDANMKDKDDKSVFRSFYQAMIGIAMDKYEAGANPTGTPEVSIKYTLKKDSSTVTIDLISKDTNYYYAMKNGVYTNKVILKSVLDESDGLRAQLKATLQAIGETK